jgi:hypothetical protein
MKALTTSSLHQLVSRLVCTVPLDGALGAACGALYGFVFGGFGALNHSETWRIASVALHFTEWGLGIGALVGVVVAFLNEDESAIVPVEAARDVVVLPLRMVSAIKAAGATPIGRVAAGDTARGATLQVLPNSAFETRASA